MRYRTQTMKTVTHEPVDIDREFRIRDRALQMVAHDVLSLGKTMQWFGVALLIIASVGLLGVVTGVMLETRDSKNEVEPFTIRTKSGSVIQMGE